MKSQVRSGGDETGTGGSAFSRFVMPTFRENVAARVGVSST
jgi:hypothetical protein